MGFAGGLPFLLTLTVLQAWLTAENVDLATIGLLALIGLPYNFKFLWAPLLDRFNPLGLGRRRSWLVITQIALALSIAGLGLQDPMRSVGAVAAAACLVALFSATQDIVIDAYRSESLSSEEQGLGASMYVYGYRLGNLASSAGGLILADLAGFTAVYLLMAGIMVLMAVTSLFAPEPISSPDRPGSLRDAFVDPFVEFFQRHDAIRNGAIVLTFILVYNLGINLSNHMTIPFFLATGFSNTEIGAVTTFFGIGPYLFGVFVGGVLQLRTGLFNALVFTGGLKGIAIAGFVALFYAGDNVLWLSAVVGLQSIAMGLGTAALMAFIANLTDPRFTATQFALFTALAALPRATLTAPTGWMASEMGWVLFFLFCALMAVPGVLLLLAFRPLFQESTPVAGTA